jgi:phage antirepressor YoqD-like protein
MNEITVRGGSRMTVKEVAVVLGVDPEAIKKHIRDIYPNLMRNGLATHLDERQVTEIKRRMIPTTEVVGAVTALEIAEMTLKVIEYHKAEADRLRARVMEIEPDAAAARVIASADGLKTLSAVGKINGIGPRRFIELLSDHGILFRSQGCWVPYQRYIDSGYFSVRERAVGREGEEFLRSQTYVTGKGEVWLVKQFFATEGEAS